MCYSLFELINDSVNVNKTYKLLKNWIGIYKYKVVFSFLNTTHNLFNNLFDFIRAPISFD